MRTRDLRLFSNALSAFLPVFVLLLVQGCAVKLRSNPGSDSASSSTSSTTSGSTTSNSTDDAATDGPLAIDTNAGLSGSQGIKNTLSSSQLSSSSTVADNLIVYTIGTAPTNGTLYLSGTALTSGSTFTQADIAAGLLSYRHAGGSDTSDSFTFTIDDGVSSVASTTFNITVASLCAGAALTNAPFADGGTAAGTLADPYPICTAAQMKAIGSDSTKWGGYFELLADIDLSSLDTNTDGELSDAGEWTLIGDLTTKFTGTFDGNGKTISKFYYSSAATSYVALFGYIQGDGTLNGSSDGHIKNLQVTKSAVSGNQMVGLLVGRAETATIQDVSVIGASYSTGDAFAVTGSYYVDVLSAGGFTGGMIGYSNTNVTFTRLYAMASVKNVAAAVGYTGGLVGMITAGSTLSYSGAYGDVQSTGANGDYTGGLAGYNTGTISYGFAHGHVRTGSRSAGGLVGILWSNGVVSDSYATGNVHYTGATGTNLGGLVGVTMSATITSSYATGNVVSGTTTSDYYIGGLVGSCSGDVTKSYATGNVKGGDYVGGLIGYLNHTAADITHVYATGAVTGTNYVGGLIGGIVVYNSLLYTFATGAVTGSSSVGWLIGNKNAGAAAVNNAVNFWDAMGNTRGTAGNTTGSAGGTAKSTADMKTATTFTGVGFDFVDESGNGNDDIWVMRQQSDAITYTSDYPRLTSVYKCYGAKIADNDYTTTGATTHTGTRNDPYVICKASQFAAIGVNSGTWDNAFEIGDSMSLSGYSQTNLTVIGNSTIKFTGNIDGRGNTLSDFTYDDTAVANLGFIGTLLGDGGIDGSADGEIKNLAFSNISVKCSMNCGVVATSTGGRLFNVSSLGGTVKSYFTLAFVSALVGSNSGYIIRSTSSTDITGFAGGSYIGGLAANNQGTVFMSGFTGTVTASNASAYVGGIVGSNSGGSVLQSFSSATISAASSMNVGGIAGSVASASKVRHSYNTGNVTGSTNQAAGVGYIYNPNAVFYHSYAAADYAAAGIRGGFIADDAGTAPTITSCYWDVDLTTNALDADASTAQSEGGTGYSSVNMKTLATFSGWDITTTTFSSTPVPTTWRMAAGDYPRLWWE